MQPRSAPPKPKAFSYIRMSTEGQLKGDSLRRQVERSKQYAADHGLDLDVTTSFNDIGVSAFRGKNLSRGALSLFKEAVLTKKIAPGSYLLVESLDRFSRDEVAHAHTEFLQLIKAGINVVTLIDQRVFRPGKLDMMDLIMSLMTLARANDESKHKSDRLSKSWANKRANADKRKLTARCPAWLRLSADKTKFEVVKERAAVVRGIFENSAKGIGNYTITRQLNQKRIPRFAQQNAEGKPYKRQSDGWQICYVAKILNSPAVYGEYQPHRLNTTGKRVPHGPPLLNYYPAIVDKDLYLRAKQARHSRDFSDPNAPKGAKGAFYSNLFSGLAKCAYCGSSMWFEDKGASRKNGTYLVCDKVKRGLGCPNVRWRYDEFEASFLYFVQELDLQSLLLKNDKQNQMAVAIQVLQGRLTILREQQEKTFELHLANTSESSFVARKLTEFEQQIGEIEAEIARATSAQATMKAEAKQFEHSKDEVKALIDRLQKTTDEEAYQLRARVASALRSLVKTVRIAGAGERHLVGFEHINKTFPHVGVDQTDWRYFEVRLKDGTFRIVKPGIKDPLFLRAQLAEPARRGAERWPVQIEP
jgi:DNA invertase Pin-like site-specific DNA recombinase